MADHIANDEELEAFKRWWKENGLPILLAVVLGSGGWFAWQQWQGSRGEKAAAGSLVYLQMMEPFAGIATEELTEEQLALVSTAANELKAEYSGAQYGALAGLMLAKLAVAQDELDAAMAELRWVMDESKDDALADIARLRLVRILSALEQYDEALELAERKVVNEITSGMAEARGDIYYLQEDMVSARAAYQSALDNLTSQDGMVRPLLEIKLNQVLPPAMSDLKEKPANNTISLEEDPMDSSTVISNTAEENME